MACFTGFVLEACSSFVACACSFHNFGQLLTIQACNYANFSPPNVTTNRKTKLNGTRFLLSASMLVEIVAFCDYRNLGGIKMLHFFIQMTRNMRYVEKCSAWFVFCRQML